MYGDLILDRSVTIPAAELVWRFSRSGGPGGQGVNTADSRVELLFDLAGSSALPEHLKARALERLAGRLVDGVLAVNSSAHRQQLDNRRAAARKLALILTDAMAPGPPPRRATRPSARSVRQRLDSKRRHGDLKRGRRDRGD